LRMTPCSKGFRRLRQARKSKASSFRCCFLKCKLRNLVIRRSQRIHRPPLAQLTNQSINEGPLSLCGSFVFPSVFFVDRVSTLIRGLKRVLVRPLREQEHCHQTSHHDAELFLQELGIFHFISHRTLPAHAVFTDDEAHLAERDSSGRCKTRTDPLLCEVR